MGGVDIRVLGPVEVCIGGRVADLGHARQRCVLVALLLDANRVVSIDQLVDRIWAERPPQRARPTLASYLSRLRQALAPAQGVTLARRDSGVQFTVDPQTVDLYRFRDLTARARARAADDPDGAAALFTESAALWRGEAFTGLSTPWLDSVRRSLTDERLGAELDCIDIRLAQGQHAALLGELTARAVAHPLDERVAGQLLLALYRSGRQADALHHYERLRRSLADELGVDPGASLRELHRRILRANPDLIVSPPGNGPVPRQLPAPPAAFTGRDRELAELDTLMTPDRVVVCAVSGTAGVGKTALAVHWAHRVADRFPDGQLYVNLRGFDPGGAAMRPADALRGLLDALGAEPNRVPSDVDGQVALYRSLLTGRRVLIMLDNARDADQVRPLLPGSPGCLALVTSRHQLTGLVAAEGARPLALEPLDGTEAHELLDGRIGRARIAAEPEAAAEIVAYCAGLPLALCLLAARAATRPRLPLRALADELRTAMSTLDAFASGDRSTDIRAVFACSYRTLRAPTARLFRQLGLHPGPDVSIAAAASLAGHPVARVRPLLAELAEASLIGEYRSGRYVVHDLLKAYAGERARHEDPGGDRRDALRRLFDHYLRSADAASHRLYPLREAIELAEPADGIVVERPVDDRAAGAWFADELRALLAAVELAAAERFDAHAWQLISVLSYYLDMRARWREWAGALRVALAATERLGDRSAEASVRRGLGRACAFLGAYDEAGDHLRRALALFTEFGDLNGQAHIHIRLAMMLDQQGRPADALAHARRALALHRAAGAGDEHLAGTISMVGWYQGLLGDYPAALTTSTEALGLLERHGNRMGAADTLHSIGYIQHRLGNYAEAAAAHRRALEVYRDLGGDPYYEAIALDDLGDTWSSAGDPAAARECWEQACDMFDRLGSPRAEQIRAKLADLR